ncbi:hypothetical protein [Sinomonas terrae]|uniref:Uncharacterized protein n=1 Tax=Sinomonas terrae TaxID=2908838 RepID=A0ABS9TWU7_9MICC|nr:hypothetical protein [Sinomonas terrae]MCH6468898.1 hypothetical protein [Sinomonas terrae]
MKAFLSLHAELTWAIHTICAAQSPDTLKNHAADALECLIGDSSGSPAPLDHLLGLQIQNHVALFGPMTLVRAVATEFDAGFIVEEYERLSKRVPITEGPSSTNSLVK